LPLIGGFLIGRVSGSAFFMTLFQFDRERALGRPPGKNIEGGGDIEAAVITYRSSKLAAIFAKPILLGTILSTYRFPSERSARSAVVIVPRRAFAFQFCVCAPLGPSRLMEPIRLDSPAAPLTLADIGGHRLDLKLHRRIGSDCLKRLFSAVRRPRLAYLNPLHFFRNSVE
jgi:hypothetical protein